MLQARTQGVYTPRSPNRDTTSRSWLALLFGRPDARRHLERLVTAVTRIRQVAQRGARLVVVAAGGVAGQFGARLPQLGRPPPPPLPPLVLPRPHHPQLPLLPP